MASLRSVPALVLVVAVCIPVAPCAASTPRALGILTQAYGAHLNEAAAFPGLSVYEGECLSTEAGGRLGVRAGRITLALSGGTSATLHRIDGGAHVDMDSGTLFFAAQENAVAEVHAEEALVRPEGNELAQALITILGPKVLQVAARHGNLAFRYRQEFQILPEGGTYRIYLDAPAEPQEAAGAGAVKSGRLTKVSYFVVSGAATGLAAWGIHEWIVSGSGIESPAKP